MNNEKNPGNTMDFLGYFRADMKNFTKHACVSFSQLGYIVGLDYMLFFVNLFFVCVILCYFYLHFLGKV